MNERLRVHQGRPRGAARRRRDLHGGRAGDDRPRRLAAERLPDPRAGAVLRRHVLPAGRRGTGCRRGRQVLEAVAEAWRDAARRDRRGQGGRIAAAAGRGARSRRPRSTRCRPSRWTTRSSRPAADVRRRARRLRRRAEVPAACAAADASSCCARGERRPMPAADAAARWPPAASTTRSAAASRATRSTRRGLVPHFEKMLYDNALLARAYLHGWQVTGEPLFRRVVRGDAGLGAARAARARGRVPSARWTPTPRASRASSTCGRSTSSARRSAPTRDAAIAWLRA